MLIFVQTIKLFIKINTTVQIVNNKNVAILTKKVQYYIQRVETTNTQNKHMNIL